MEFKMSPKIEKIEHSNKIMGVVVDIENIDPETKIQIEEIKKDGQEIREYRSHSDYIMEEPNSSSKYSERYHTCIGLAIVGTDLVTGKKISILTHHDPVNFNPDLLERNKGKIFVQKMNKNIQEIKKQCIPGSIDAVIFGGNRNYVSSILSFSKADYKKSITELGKMCAENLGFEPTVITGPNMSEDLNNNGTNIYLNTQKCRLYIVRANQEDTKTNNSFAPPDVSKQIKENKWKFKKV